MSYESRILNGLFVVRWERPERGDPTRYCNELSEAARRQGKPLVGLFIMPETSTVPDDAFRKEQATLLSTIMSNLVYAIAVFEGSGFSASVKRSALIAITLLSGQRQRIHVRSTVTDALRNPPERLPFDVNGALRELQAHGFYEDSVTSSRRGQAPRNSRD
jgi:hypothetical protein